MSIYIPLIKFVPFIIKELCEIFFILDIESSSKSMNQTCVPKCPEMFGSDEKITSLYVKNHCF